MNNSGKKGRVCIKGNTRSGCGRTRRSLIGVNVSINGGSGGTITNLNGDFTIRVTKNDFLKVSYIGYTTQMVKISDKTVYNITMASDTKALDEVVVTALGIKREAKALTYNVQEIKAAGITKVKDANFINSLSGKVAGVTINQSSSGTGGSSRVVMRGTKSLFGENNALYVLDGIPMQGLRTKQSDNFYESVEVADGDGISNINPEDIESISVLKGGSAALYGMRAGNGVILVTTKSGKKDKGVSISYEGDITIDRVYNLPRLQNKYGQGYYASEYDWKEAQAGGYSGDYQTFALENGYNYVDGMGSGINDNAG